MTSIHPTIHPSSEQLAAFGKAPVEGPIFMLNLLKFKPGGGAESYAKYGEAVAPFLDKVHARVVYSGKSLLTVIGEDAWDLVILVEYPSREAMFSMITDAEYQKIAQHRTDALLDSRLYLTQPGRA